MGTFFPYLLKLFYFKKKGFVTLSIRVSEVFAQTYHIQIADFEDILEGYRGSMGVERDAYFVIEKKNFVRWTFNDNKLSHNFRLPKEAWSQFVEQYQKELSALRPDQDIFFVNI